MSYLSIREIHWPLASDARRRRRRRHRRQGQLKLKNLHRRRGRDDIISTALHCKTINHHQRPANRIDCIYWAADIIIADPERC